MYVFFAFVGANESIFITAAAVDMFSSVAERFARYGYTRKLKPPEHDYCNHYGKHCQHSHYLSAAFSGFPV